MASLVSFNGRLLSRPGGLVVTDGTHPPIPPVQLNTYFKLDITHLQSSNIMQLSEIEFYVGSSRISVAFLAGTPGTTYDDVEEAPIYMFDGSTATKWCVRSSSSYLVGKAVGTYAPTSYRMATCTDSGTWTGRNPSSWTISVAESATDITLRDDPAWVVVDTRVSDTTMRDVNQTFFDFTIPSASASQDASNRNMIFRTSGSGLLRTGLGSYPGAGMDDTIETDEWNSLGTGGYSEDT